MWVAADNLFVVVGDEAEDIVGVAVGVVGKGGAGIYPYGGRVGKGGKLYSCADTRGRRQWKGRRKVSRRNGRVAMVP